MHWVYMACASHIGRVRQNHEDNYYFAGETLPEGNSGSEGIRESGGALRKGICVGLFDGMGGLAKGEVASAIAAETLKTMWETSGGAVKDNEAFFMQVTNLMNRNVIAAAASRPMENMGTTMAAVLFRDAQATICNVGDSPIFLLRNAMLEEISQEHTDRTFLTAHGELQKKPRLTQYIGITEEKARLSPSIRTIPLEARDVYLLCSDGLTDMVSRGEVEQILNRHLNSSVDGHWVHACTEELLETALANGGRDNISIILCCVHERTMPDGSIVEGTFLPEGIVRAGNVQSIEGGEKITGGRHSWLKRFFTRRDDGGSSR